jgi:KDO2-lipid IV(A) lauroyltransferase
MNHADTTPSRVSPSAVRWHRHRLNNHWIFTATYLGVSRIPRRLSYGIGWVGTRLAYRMLGEATAAVLANLRLAFPDRSEGEIRRLALETYWSYARDAIDFMRSLKLGREELARMVFRIDREVFDRVLAGGKGALLVTGHFGNWELGAVFLRRLYDYPLSVVAMAEPNPGVNRWRRRFRDGIGVDTLEVRQSVDTALQIRRRLGEGRLVAMLMDRALGRDRVEVRFLGHRAFCLRTPALLAHLTGAPLVPCFVIRRADGRFEARVADPLYVDRKCEPEESVARVSQAFATALEEEVRQNPQLWYQFYPYWEENGAGEGP